MSSLTDDLKSAAADTARRGAWIAGGGVALAVGLGFATLAGWLVLETMRGPLFAALVLCCVYLGIGFVMLSLGLRHKRRVTQAERLAAAAAATASAAPVSPGISASDPIEVQVMEAVLRLQNLAQALSDAPPPRPAVGDEPAKGLDMGVVSPLLASFVIGLDLARMMRR
ncbi:phage holin family protein [Phaeovulum sp. W22_SRMD_FR3]|uniref:phage holin family protein n=1 Tax=Phaeovulum sp. W22_SRMD_FR3 TaxID=3240274 RepID=UPI003F98AA16